MIALLASRRPARSDEVEQALERLDDRPGAYFGCDAGIAGLHPLQATLLDEPALALRLHGDGLDVQACSALGQALLAHPALAGWLDAARRGQGRHPVQSLRRFMAAFVPAPEVMLLGALPFNAHRLAALQPGGDDEPLGLLFFAERHWQRTADGLWQRIELTLHGLPGAASPVAPSIALPRVPQTPAGAPRDDYPSGGHAAMVARGLEQLRDPSLVSLTLSQSFRRRAAISPAQAFARLRRVNPAPATFFLNDGAGECLFGASPDLQLSIRQGQVEAMPVCGTVARGPGPVGEAESFRELVNHAVDAASLAVCTDALRNDLAPLCEPGSLRLLDRRRPLSLSTVVHTVDRLGGRLRAGVDAWDAIVATAAPAMVTGTPRRAALAAISRLEASPRGWYGGLMVQVRADGDALVGTLLRAAVIRAGVAEVRTGGDLMADSDPQREEQESRLKAISLWRALGIDETAPDRPPAPARADAPRVTRVALLDAGDPFTGAVLDTLAGLGATLDARADTAVLIGHDAAACRRLLADRPRGPLVALGEAAFHVLAHAGFAIEAGAPSHGRLLHCRRTALAPWPGEARFFAAGYSRHALMDSRVLPGWEVWATDEQQRPMLLVHNQDRLVCILFRPDSLLSDPVGRDALSAALAFVSQG